MGGEIFLAGYLPILFAIRGKKWYNGAGLKYRSVQRGIREDMADMENDKQVQFNFLKSYDFMKLGQALDHKNWQIAAMTVQRMQKGAQEAGLAVFERQFSSIRQCIIHKQGKQAKDILALVIAKRAQLLNQHASEADAGRAD